MLYAFGAVQSRVLWPVRTTMLLLASAEVKRENLMVNATVKVAMNIVYKIVRAACKIFMLSVTHWGCDA